MAQSCKYHAFILLLVVAVGSLDGLPTLPFHRDKLYYNMVSDALHEAPLAKFPDNHLAAKAKPMPDAGDVVPLAREQLATEPLHTVIGNQGVRVYEEVSSSGNIKKGVSDTMDTSTENSSQVITTLLLLACITALSCQFFLICALAICMNAKINSILRKDQTPALNPRHNPSRASGRSARTTTTTTNTPDGEYEAIAMYSW